MQDDDYAQHELLDRLHLVAKALEDWVLAHPALPDHPDAARDVDAAVDALGRAYQAVGRAHLADEGPP